MLQEYLFIKKNEPNYKLGVVTTINWVDTVKHMNEYIFWIPIKSINDKVNNCVMIAVVFMFIVH